MSYQKRILSFFEEKVSHPVNIGELLIGLELPSEKYTLIRKELRDLIKRGFLVKLKKGRYGLPAKMSLVTGIYQAHPDGFGFVLSEDAEAGDVYVGSRKRGEAMDGDMVVARVEASDRLGKRGGRIIQVLERAHKEVVGKFERGGTLGFVIPLNPRLFDDMFVPKEAFGGAKAGDIVMAEIVQYPQRKRNPEGKIVEILGKLGDPDIDLKVVVKNHNLPDRFSRESLEEAARYASEAVEGDESRVDIRDDVVFTIDGDDAKDFDDAVSIGMTDEGDFKLGVHIADVSHYVRSDSAVDKEAYKRGTSVYFPGTVIPMLPFELSNGICSLKENEDRLCLSVEIIFSSEGERKSCKVFKTIIKSKKRLTYSFVKRILDGESSIEEFPYISQLMMMNSLAALLREKRFSMGSLDFDLPEPQFHTDMYGKILSIEKRERNEAHKLIEEFMLAANEAVADWMISRKHPVFFRVHEPPDEGKAADLFETLKSFKYKVPKGNFKEPKVFQEILKNFEGKPEETVVQMLILRSLKQANYSADNKGHFGLAMKNYTHFTSPIRRYPDLYTHRMIKCSLLNGKMDENLAENLDNAARHTSIRERIAEGAERDFVDLKRTEFMEKRIGNIYEGTISGVNSFGFFVELDDIFVEGLVRVRTLGNDYYKFMEKELKLVGEKTKKVFSLGKRVRVQLSEVNMEKRHIDFSLV